MKLHWSPRSPFVRKVMIVAHETGLVDRLELIRSVAAMNATNDALMADNPLNKLPTLVLDDGEPVYDSLVICAYLDSLHQGRRLIPEGDDRWRVLRWHALANGVLDLLVLWRNELGRPPAAQSAPHLSAFAAKTTASLDRLEAELPALTATAFDLAHVGLGCALGYLDFRFRELDWRAARPALTAFGADFEGRASARATIPSV